MGGWQCVPGADGAVNVIPDGDLLPHQFSDDCVCGPRTEAVFRDDGSNGWMFVHSSLDGRELSEPDYDPGMWNL